MTHVTTQNREKKHQIVWAPRGRLFWPAEVQDKLAGSAVCFKYLGPKEERAVAADPSSAISFISNFDRLSKQSSDPDFVRAVMEAVHLSSEKLPAEWQERKKVYEDILNPDAPSLCSDKNSASDDDIFDEENGPAVLGSSVRIREAQAIHPKLHPYENTEAIIVRLPISPSTWYCVKFYDGNVVKIRRTAFELLPERHTSVPVAPEIVSRQSEKVFKEDIKLKRPRRPSLYRRNAPRDSKMKRKIMVDVPEESPKRRKHHGKTRGAKSNLVGKYVTIECGRYKGEKGFVIRGGNGYYCVQLGGRNSGSSNNVMKRSSDLRPIPFPSEGDCSRNKSTRYSVNRGDQSAVNCKNESWVNRRVRVKAGKHQGETGTIRRSGHGFYCVSIKGVGDVMKRASDLELCKEKEDVKPKRKFGERDSNLEFAATILVDMMTVEGSSESEYEEDSSASESYLPGAFTGDLTVVTRVPKKPVEIPAAFEGLPESELNTPLLKSSSEGDIMTWDHKEPKPRQALRSVLLPRSGSERCENRMQSLPTYW